MNDKKRTPNVAVLCAKCNSMAHGYESDGFYYVRCLRDLMHPKTPPCKNSRIALAVWNAMQAGEEELKDIIAKANMTVAYVPAVKDEQS